MDSWSPDVPRAEGRCGLPSPSAAFELCELVRSLCTADDADAIAVLERASRIGGADAALFAWRVRQEGTESCLRSISALDPRWGSDAVQRLQEPGHEWLAHAIRSSEPRLLHLTVDANPTPSGHEHRRQVAWLVPAPTPHGSEVLGLLVVAAREACRQETVGQLLPAYRALALGLSDWFQRRARDELVSRAQLTERDLDLLRHESMGHGSKRIAASMNTLPKTIDCRFHRLNLRLGVASRREAVRLCRHCGLL